MDAWLSAADLAHLYGVAKGTIQRWASQDRWRRRGTYRKAYHLGDAQASYDRRHLQAADQHGKISAIQ